MPTLTLFREPGLDWRSAWAGGAAALPLPASVVEAPAPRQVARTRVPTEPKEAKDRLGHLRPEGLNSQDLLSEDLLQLEQVRTGDEDAARALVERLYPTVLRMVRSHLPRRTQEEDLAQAVFAKVFAKMDQFSGRVPLEHWVARIAINTCLNQLKHELVRPELRMSDLSEEQEAVVDHLACTSGDLPDDQAKAARELLEQLLAHLPADDRLVITLLHLEERSTEEISRLTGWSVSWVKVRAFRARHKMRELWSRLFDEEVW